MSEMAKTTSDSILGMIRKVWNFR